MPPSTYSVVPVTYPASSEARIPHGGGDFLRRALTAGRDRLDDLVRGQVSRHVGGDEARGDRVDGHAAPRDLGGDGLGHADQAGLGRGVVGLPGVRARSDDRGDVDHAPVTGLDHRAQRIPREPEGGREVGADDRVPVLVRELQHDVVARDARVVDEREHGPAELLLDLLEERLAVTAGDVGVDGLGLAAGLLDGGDDGVGAGLVGAVVDRDGPAVGGQRLGDRRADALGGTGDEGDGVLGAAHDAVHSITPAPHVKPAPIAPSRTFMPGLRRPSSRERLSVSGIDAADVLPSWAM